ncbi:glycosyltransferase family 2 protein [Paeniglutamicibacter antarcticus]|uniref:Glycosyltransferase family 2 protein n=1 Tax=Paeniglutamicibacter antarcticus TaxID=494023 RepID=A0ABP9TLS4_9MICC
MPSTSTPTGSASGVPGLISVIIPALDQQDFIADALASLANQQLGGRELEVLLIDDASTDATAVLGAGFGAQLPGLRIISHGTTLGVSAARNTGLEHATGEFIAFLDPDDWMGPEQLRLLAQGLEDLGVDFVRCDHVRVSGTKRELHRAPQARRNTTLDPVQDIAPIHTASMIDYPFVWAGMYRTDVLAAAAPRFKDSLRTCEDREWFWRLCLNAESYAVLDAPGIFYRRGVPGSLTGIFDERQLDFLPAYASILSMATEGCAEAGHGAKAMRQFFAIACHHLARSEQFTPALRTRLRGGTAKLLAESPAELVARSLDQLDAPRRKILTGLRASLSGQVA